MHQSHVQDKRRQSFHFRIRVRDECAKARDVFLGDMALVQVTQDFVQALNPAALLAWHALAILAYVVPVTAPSKSLIGTSAAADATEMAHGHYPSYDP